MSIITGRDPVDPRTIEVGRDTIAILARTVERRRITAEGAKRAAERLYEDYSNGTRVLAAADRELAQAILDLQHARESLTSLVERDPDIDLVNCAECGHLHYVPAFKVYVDCNVCACEGQR